MAVQFRCVVDRRGRARRGGLVLAVALALASAAAAQPVIQEFPLPTAGSLPDAITVGPDGNLWFVQPGSGRIGRIRADASHIDEFPLPVPSQAASTITAGPDGALWFLGSNPIGGAFYGRITIAGAVTTWALPPAYTPNGGDLVSGPDGLLWFAAGDRIGRFDTGNGFFDPITLDGSPGAFGLTVRSTFLSAAAWFTQRTINQIGRVNADLSVTSFAGITPGSEPPDITVGPDDNLWFTERYADKIGRITPAGVVTEFGGLTPGSRPYGITSGPDGNLWFTENAGNRIGRITPTGAVTEFGGLTAGSAPTSIVSGPDDGLWFTESSGNRIGRVSLPACDVAETVPAAGGTFTRSTVGASTLAGSCGGPGPERVFRWTPSRAGTALIETCGAGTTLDTAVYLRSGTCTGSEVACSDDACATATTTNRGSRLTPFVGEGQTYYIVVDGYGSGTFQLKVIPPGPGCEAPLQVPGDGGSFFGSISGASGMQGSCGGAGPERVFQWTPDHSGRATIRTCSASTDFDTVLYVRADNCVRGSELACNDDACLNGAGLARASLIELDVVAGETYFIMLDGYGSGGNYGLEVYAPTPCDDIETLPAAGGVFNGTTRGANTLIGPCGGNGAEKVYRWMPQTSGTATIDTCAGATYETVLYVRDGDCQNGAPVACNQIAFCGAGVFSSRVYPDVVAGHEYYIVVDGADGQSGSFTLSVAAPAPPTATASATPPPTSTASASPVPTATATGSPTATSTLPPPTASATASASATRTTSHTPVSTPSRSATPSSTSSPTRSATATASATASQPVSPTATATSPPPATASVTATRSPASPTGTATATPTGSIAPTFTPVPTATPETTITPTPTPTPLPCAGDCNGDGFVSIAEVITLVNIALGSFSPATCPRGDLDGDGAIRVHEIVAAVGRALHGCAAAATSNLASR